MTGPAPDRPPVPSPAPVPGPTVAPATRDAGRALRAAVALAGIDVDAPRLLRHGTHAVFALGPLVGRVAPDSPTTRRTAVRSLAVSRWLAGAGFPAVRAVPDRELAVPQPIVTQGHLVTFWESLGDTPRPGSAGDLGRLLRAFHALRLPPDLAPDPVDPVGRVASQLATARLDDADRAFLAARLDRLAGRYARLDLHLPPGHVHGDAVVANVVVDGTGRPTLIDLDLLRTGPREWDLVRSAVYAHRLGWLPPAEYAAFCAAYGTDVATAPGFDVLADLGELLQVAWLADAAVHRPELGAELAVRIGTLRSDGDRRVWRAV